MAELHDDPLAILDPSPDALLDLLRAQVDDALLREIAAADYGMEADTHLCELRRIRDTGRVPVRFDWCPMEVLALTRWSDPGEPSGVGDEACLREHLKRAFCCAALLRGSCEPGNADVEFGPESDSLAQALGSISLLGPEVELAALRFVAWRARDRPGHDSGYEADRAFFALAVAILAIGPGKGGLGEGWLERVGWWVIRQAEADGMTSPGFTYRGLKYGVWQHLAARMLEKIEGLIAGDAREVLRAVAELVVQ